VIIVHASLYKLYQWKHRSVIGGNMFLALLRFSRKNFYFHSRNRWHNYDNNVCVCHSGKWYNSGTASLLLECGCKGQGKHQEKKLEWKKWKWLIYTACDLIIGQQQIMRDCDKISYERYFTKPTWWEMYTWESLFP